MTTIIKPAATPRTDAVVWSDDFGTEQYVKAELARTLERESDHWQREFAKMTAERDEFRATKLPVGGQCADCGFRYWEYKGHLIPCPRCELSALRAVASREGK
jgi:hypothetical protein